jgi:hypothetical protein
LGVWVAFLKQNESKEAQNIYFYLGGALGQTVHQAVSKTRPKPQKLDITFRLETKSNLLTDFGSK